MMRSESTSAFGQPSDTKLTFGAGFSSARASAFSVVVSTMRRSLESSVRPLIGGKGGADRLQGLGPALRDRVLDIPALAERAHLTLTCDGRLGHMGLDAELAQGVGDLLHLGGAAGAGGRPALPGVRARL